MRSVARRVYLWLPPVAYAVGIFVLSAQSDPLPQVTSILWDKGLHTAEYAGLAFLVGRAVHGEGVGKALAAATAVLIAASYGATDEWHQSLVAARVPSALDWIADLFGSLLGSAAYWCLAVWRPLTPKS